MTERDAVAVRTWLLVGILLLAFGLRTLRLGSESLWYDETVSVYLASKELPAMVDHTAGDIHPPGYYALLHAWLRATGSSGFAVAFFSLFWGLLLVVLAFRVAADLYGERAGLLAAALVAISPFNLWYSQEVRMYTLAAVLGMALLIAVRPLLLTRLASPRSATRAVAHPLILYVTCGALGLWTLYYFAFLLIAINLMVGTWWLTRLRNRTQSWRWLGLWGLAQGVVVALYSPWIPVLWRQATLPPVPPWRGFTPLGALLHEAWSALSLGQSADPRSAWVGMVLTAALFGLGMALASGFYPSSGPRSGPSPGAGGHAPLADRGFAWFLAGYVLLPILLIYLASFVTPLYHVRYLFTYSTPFYVVVAGGLAHLWERSRLAGALPLVVLSALCALSVHAYHTDPHYASDDHRAAVRFLAERWRPGDAILINAGYAYTALMVYWDGDPIAWRGRLSDGPPERGTQGPALFQTGTTDGDPTLGWGDPESDFYTMTQADLEAALERLFASFHRVWVYRIYDTVTDPHEFVRRWLADHGRPFEDRGFTGSSQLRVQGYLTDRDPAAVGAVLQGVALNDGSLELWTSAVPPAAAAVGGSLDLELVWNVRQSVPEERILFAGLFDGTGRRWAQVDERPLGSLYPVTDWARGSVVRTPLRLPVESGVPPGRYRLEVGWYHFVAGQPVWLPWSKGERLTVAQIDVAAPRDWWALPRPDMTQTADITIGSGVRLMGFDLPSTEVYAGEKLPLDLLWRALEDAPAPGPAVLQLKDAGGQVLALAASAPVMGRVPFASLKAGQGLRDPWALTIPVGLPPGEYDLVVGRQTGSGEWLEVQRGTISLGSTYPLATIRIVGRSAELMAPAVQNPVNALFGGKVRLMGYDLLTSEQRIGLTLYWQARSPMDIRYKVFVHLVPSERPSEILAQADLYPHLPTTSWRTGEYLQDSVAIDLPPAAQARDMVLLVGLYDEATGERLPVLNAEEGAPGLSVMLGLARPGQ